MAGGIKWNNKAFRQIRTLPEVRRELERRAEAIAREAGDGYTVESEITRGRGRARAAVFPTTSAAIRDNAANNTLLKALDAGRG